MEFVPPPPYLNGSDGIISSLSPPVCASKAWTSPHSQAHRVSHRVSHRHRTFLSPSSLCEALAGDKKHVINRILVANNGIGAVKLIRSVRKFAFETFGNEKAISFIVMATPEDLKANAEYIRMSDTTLFVPGGSNQNNYANVSLILELSRLHQIDAVWAGWGHASENPKLPELLKNIGVKFIGPGASAMKALGDKIGSTIIAQSAGVPCIEWNGSEVLAEYDKETGDLPEGVYEKGCVTSGEEAEDVSKKIGFPVMIKASEGGGGRG